MAHTLNGREQEWDAGTIAPHLARAGTPANGSGPSRRRPAPDAHEAGHDSQRIGPSEADGKPSFITVTMRDQRKVRFRGDQAFCEAIRASVRRQKASIPNPTAGDDGTPALEASDPPSRAALTPAATQGTKVCPQCAEEVKAAARICRFCRHEFTGAGDLMSGTVQA